MKPPGTVVRHDQHEYLLLEAGFSADTRSLIVMARPADPRFPAPEGQQPLTWGSQGHWVPVARWTPEELQIPIEAHVQHAELLRTLIEAHVARAATPVAVAWTLRDARGFVGSLQGALPMGVAAVCHDTRQGAEAAAQDAEVVAVDNLAMFFTALVREGYAGLMWNATQPVFFCVDESGDLRFLRVSSVGPSSVELEVLDESGAWETYEGADELEFIDNAEACDRRLTERLGLLPVIDWPQDNCLWSLGPSLGVPAVVLPEGAAESDTPRLQRHDGSLFGEASRDGGEGGGQPHAVLFTDEAAAQAFRAELAPEMTIFPVRDLPRFLVADELAGHFAALNPGAHRAATGVFWSDGERVVLDSFSGFWKYEAGQFERLE